MTPPNRLKVAAAATLSALAGLTGFALTSAPDDQAQPAAAPVKPPPTEVRTKVIRRTIHRVRREKPAVAPTPGRAVATSPPAPVPAAAPVAQTAPVRTVAAAPPSGPVSEPVTTRTSGSSGRGGEDDDRFESDDYEAEHGSGEAEHEDD